MSETKKLFKVKLRGFEIDRTEYSTCYVIATHPTEAYEVVKKYLDEQDLGFEEERALQSIELIAEDDEFPECDHRLFC